MDVFLTLYAKIMPLFIIMVLGYVAGKFLRPDTKSIATVTIYLVSPMVFFMTVAKMHVNMGAILMPAISLGLAIGVAMAVLKLSKSYLDTKGQYLSALMAGTSNWGYFGIPIAFALFDPSQVALYVLIGFGTQIFENSFGVYFVSRGNMSPLESIKNVFKFPVLYAIVLGISVSYTGLQIPVLSTDEFFNYFKGAYVVLGMMMIGLGLADMHKITIDKRFLATAFAVKFLIFPLAAICLIWLDKHILMIFGQAFYAPFMLFSLMPMAANNIAFATKFDMDPGRVSVAVVVTTLFALVYIPLAINILGIQ
jgi:predicted permease